MALLENFERIVRDVVSSKKIHLSSFGWARIARIGKGIKKGETRAADVVGELQGEQELRLNLEDSDWREIEKKIDRILRN